MNSKKKLKVGTFFSGIGSPEKALERLKQQKLLKEYEIMFFSEINENAVKSYCAIHGVDNSLNLGSITEIKGSQLPYCDLWIGGFPCQDISNAGKMRGFENNSLTRSSLGWEMIRLIKEVTRKPKYVIFENVASITNKKFIKTLNFFKEDLMSLGYKLFDNVLNAIDYGIPQTRKRYFLIAILDENINFEFPIKEESIVKLKDFLDTSVEEQYYLTDESYDDIGGNIREFTKIGNTCVKYQIDMKKYNSGGKCGIDKSSKFVQTSRIFSEYGYAPTLTASNTADNCKIAVESEKR